MQVLRNEQLIFCDCDDTLVMWGEIKDNHETVIVTDPYDGAKHTLRKHLGHIKVLKDRKMRGSFIVVWSAGGYRWAEAVVKSLKLEEYVDLVCSKPFMYIDDKEAADILGEHLYLGVDSLYGTNGKR